MSTRTVILNVLRAEARPMTIAEIGRRVGITAQLARHHIKQLCVTGRVEFVGMQPTGANGKHARTFQVRADLPGTWRREMTSNAKLVWITPDAERVIAYCARVSNPANQDNPDATKLLRYCIRNKHWSVFEMAAMCVEINTTRDIGRQILRHRSFHFQEFSGRYQSYSALPDAPLRECRLQDTKNRQNSIEVGDEALKAWWDAAQRLLSGEANCLYQEALKRGIAKEQARALLPEGLTPSRLYMHGTIRDWLHYVDLRSGNGTQKEHMEIAKAIGRIIQQELPNIHSAMWGQA